MKRQIAGFLSSFLLLVPGCTAIRQQKAIPPVTDNAGFHNVQVLPSTLTRDELIAVMRGFTKSLGVRCDHCHMLIPGGGERDFDFPSDAKPEKNVARTMLRMVQTINNDYVGKVNAHGQKVMCSTCHRGHSIPEVYVPPATPEQAPVAPTPLP